MRRPAAAALSVTLLLAGCSTDRSGDAGTAAAPTPAAPAPAASGAVVTPASAAAGDGGDRALAGNTGAVCEQAARTKRSFAATFAQDLKLQIDAAGSKDGNQIARARQKISRDVQSFSAALTDMSELVDDVPVKKALAAMAGEVAALKGDVAELDVTRLDTLGDTLDKACGQA